MVYKKPVSDNTAILLVDVQERMMRVIARGEDVEKNCALLLRTAAELSMAIFVTTQNRARIGGIMPELKELLAGVEECDKMEFSCFANPGFDQMLSALEKRPENIVVCGVESHICIYQTVRDGINAGFRMFVPADAVSSRLRASHRVALARIRELGAVVVSTEMIIYELLAKAGTPEFKALLPFIK